jgi:uncharacterized membrane protein YpjA
MNIAKIVAIMLIVGGILGLVYGSFWYRGDCSRRRAAARWK